MASFSRMVNVEHGGLWYQPQQFFFCLFLQSAFPFLNLDLLSTRSSVFARPLRHILRHRIFPSEHVLSFSFPLSLADVPTCTLRTAAGRGHTETFSLSFRPVLTAFLRHGLLRHSFTSASSYPPTPFPVIVPPWLITSLDVMDRRRSHHSPGTTDINPYRLVVRLRVDTGETPRTFRRRIHVWQFRNS